MPLKVVDINTQLNARILIYGPNGIGKTHLSLTWWGKKVVIDNTANIETARKFNQQDITVFESPHTWAELQTMWVDPILDGFDCLIMDNITGVYRDLVVDSVKTDVRERRGKVADLSDYGLASERLRIFISNLRARAYKQHIICIAHESVDKDEITGATHGGPSVPGKVPAHIMSLFSETIYMTKIGVDRVGKLSQHTYFPAATRLLLPDAVIKGPDLDLEKMYRKFFPK